MKSDWTPARLFFSFVAYVVVTLALHLFSALSPASAADAPEVAMQSKAAVPYPERAKTKRMYFVVFLRDNQCSRGDTPDGGTTATGKAGTVFSTTAAGIAFHAGQLTLSTGKKELEVTAAGSQMKIGPRSVVSVCENGSKIVASLASGRAQIMEAGGTVSHMVAGEQVSLSGAYRDGDQEEEGSSSEPSDALAVAGEQSSEPPSAPRPSRKGGGEGPLRILAGIQTEFGFVEPGVVELGRGSIFAEADCSCEIITPGGTITLEEDSLAFLRLTEKSLSVQNCGLSTSFSLCTNEHPMELRPGRSCVITLSQANKGKELPLDGISRRNIYAEHDDRICAFRGEFSMLSLVAAFPELGTAARKPITSQEQRLMNEFVRGIAVFEHVTKARGPYSQSPDVGFARRFGG